MHVPTIWPDADAGAARPKKKNGRGFTFTQRQNAPIRGRKTFATPPRQHARPRAMQRRMVLLMVNEAARHRRKSLPEPADVDFGMTWAPASPIPRRAPALCGPCSVRLLVGASAKEADRSLAHFAHCQLLVEIAMHRRFYVQRLIPKP